MTAIVSAIVIASSWSCVTWTNVIPTSFWIRFSSSCICLRSFRSSAPSGSSSRSTRGLQTSARASATRCCWPPESCRGLRFSRPARSTSSSISETRVLTSAFGRPFRCEPERDVVVDRHVREERVALEHGVDVPLVRRQPDDVAVAEEDPPGRRLLEAADHPQGRRLPASRRTEQREEGAARDLERDAVDGEHLAEPLDDVLEPDVRAPSWSRSPGCLVVRRPRRRRHPRPSRRAASRARGRGTSRSRRPPAAT